MSKEGEFLVFCKECYRAAKGMSGREASAFFARHGLYDCIMRFFDSLHATGVRYIVADLDEYASKYNADA